MLLSSFVCALKNNVVNYRVKCQNSTGSNCPPQKIVTARKYIGLF
jgi:hypothetical protein